MKTSEELHVLYETPGIISDKRVVVNCQAADRSSFTYAVLEDLVYDDVSNDSAGWQKWGNRTDTPVECP